MDTPLTQPLKRLEHLITRPAESLDDPAERAIEFRRRLERTRRLMAALGNPQDSMDIIHITGTSGKGSIAIFCEAILRALGLRVGTHTSPYLQTPLEKARVDGNLMPLEDASRLSDIVMQAIETMQMEIADLGNPHYAEAWLGLVMRYFADQGCEAGVIEVGMGGRYDATNIVMPRVSVISTIHYDHTRVLGDTLASIAFHKAGIIKAGTPVVVGEVPEIALKVVADEAARHDAWMIQLGKDVHYQPIELTERGGRFSYQGLDICLNDITIGLLGAHQFANATVALAAVEVFAAGLGLRLDETHIREGLARTRFAGRLEVVQKNPTVVLDGAHNQEKIGALIRAIPQIFRYRRLILVLGMLETKAVDPIMEALGGIADVIVTTRPHVKGKPALSADDLARIAQQAGVHEVVAEEEPLAALERALRLAGSDDLVVVTGSLYLIGMVRPYWHPTGKIVEQHTMFPNGFPTD